MPDNPNKSTKGSSLAKLLRPAATLLAICAVVSAALALTYGATKETIAQSVKNAADALRAEVMPGASFEEVDLADIAEANLADMDATEGGSGSSGARVLQIHKATAIADGSLAGYVATAAAKGYGGDVTLIVGARADGTISGVRVSDHAETPGLGANAAKPEFYGQFDGRRATAPLAAVKGGAAGDGEIAAISGATITSRAVTNAVNAASAAIMRLLGEART